jgi:hypothetical protein
MADYCLAFKILGRLSNEESLVGLIVVTKVIAELSLPGSDLIERNFALSQINLLMYSETHEM